MTVASTTNRADLTITSGTTSYPYAFRIFADGDLAVVRRHPTTGAETTMVLNTDYTVTGAGNANGGTIVISAGNATTYNGYGLTIRRVLATTQSTSIRNQGAFYPEVHEDVFDRLAMVDQQLDEEIDRSVKLPETVAASEFDPTLPAGVTTGAGRTMLVNATGDGFEMGPTATEISSAQAAATAALAALDSFDDRYLGAKASDPTLDNDGNALLTGALYWNTTTNAMRVYSGTKWTEFSSVAYVLATYTGDGVTTAFTLPVAPVSKNNLFVSIAGVNQHKSRFSVSGTTLTFVVAPPAGNEVECIIAQPLPVASADAANVTFNPSGTGAVQTNVESKLRESVSVIGFMTAAQIADVQAGTKTLDVSGAVQLAINAAGQNARIIYPKGTYHFGASVTPKPEQEHIGYGAVIHAASGVTPFSRTTDGYPGRINFKRLRFEGTGKTGTAISFTNNTPLVSIEGCYIEGFNEGVRLDGSYSSCLKNNHIVGNNFGVTILNASHSTSLSSNFIDGNTYAGLCINGNPASGSIGTQPIHNITSIGNAYQNSEFGVWAEKCLELHLTNTYHEGNTKADLRLGVADAGAYQRYCYNFTVDGWQSSSACALGKNIIMEHAVDGNLRGLAFNAGTSSSATVLSADGFSDLVNIDYHRVQHGSFTSTTPFDVPQYKFIVSRNDRKILPWNIKALRIGTNLASPEGGLYGTLTPSSFRPTIQLESLGSGYDMSFKVNDIERHYDSLDNLRFSIDHVNSRVNTAYIIQPMTDNATALGGTTNRWSVVYAGTGTINTSDERQKQDIEPIPQAWLDAWGDVQFVRFKFKDAVQTKGDGARWHVGVIAQRVKEAFEKRGIDPFAIGILCYDEWEDEYEDVMRLEVYTDEDGREVRRGVPTGEKRLVRAAGNRYGIRYEEALVLECAYLRSHLS